MRKISILLSVILVLLSAPWLLAFAEGTEKEKMPPVIDTADLFSDEEEKELRYAIYDAEKTSKCKYYVITKKDTSAYIDTHYELTDSELRAFGVDKYGNNTVLLIIDRGNGSYVYRIYTHGKSYDYIDDNEFYRIRDGIREIESKNFLGGSIKWVKMSADAYNASARATYILYVVVWVIISAVAVAIIIGVVVGRYKMKIKPTNYPLERYAKLELTDKRDLFRGTFVTRRRIPRNNGGGGRGGHGGGISGGGSRARG